MNHITYIPNFGLFCFPLLSLAYTWILQAPIVTETQGRDTCYDTNTLRNAENSYFVPVLGHVIVPLFLIEISSNA